MKAASGLYLTTPVGGPPGQPAYLNAVLALEPAPEFSQPGALLEQLLDIERQHGRTRRQRWESRTLDLDLLAFGDTTCQVPELVLPHPRLLERAFVLVPLCEALPQWRHPVTGDTACTALAALPTEGVERTGLDWGPR